MTFFKYWKFFFFGCITVFFSYLDILVIKNNTR